MKLTANQKSWLKAIRNHGSCFKTRDPIYRSVIRQLLQNGLIETFHTTKTTYGTFHDMRVTLLGLKTADKIEGIEKQQKEKEGHEQRRRIRTSCDTRTNER